MTGGCACLSCARHSHVRHLSRQVTRARRKKGQARRRHGATLFDTGPQGTRHLNSPRLAGAASRRRPLACLHVHGMRAALAMRTGENKKQTCRRKAVSRGVLGQGLAATGAQSASQPWLSVPVARSSGIHLPAQTAAASRRGCLSSRPRGPRSPYVMAHSHSPCPPRRQRFASDATAGCRRPLISAPCEGRLPPLFRCWLRGWASGVGCLTADKGASQ